MKGALVLMCNKKIDTLYLTLGCSDEQVDVKLKQSRLGHTNKMRKQKGVNFAIPHVSLEESPETMVRSRGVRQGSRASSVSGTSTPTVDPRRVAKMIKPLRWTPTLIYILLTEGGKPWKNNKILQDGRSNKWKLVEVARVDSRPNIPSVVKVVSRPVDVLTKANAHERL